MSSTPAETEEEPTTVPETKPLPERVPPPKPPKKAPPAAPSYFDDPTAARALREEALSWRGTPFREYYQQDLEKLKAENGKLKIDLKGQGGGIDCIGLAQEIYLRTGATDAFLFERSPGDYQSHGIGDKVLDWLRGKADDPQSKRLAETFLELEFPEEVVDPHALTPRDFFKPGDLLVMQHGSLFHMPIIYDDDLHFVNSVPRRGVIEGTIQDSSYSVHLVAVFRMKPKAQAKCRRCGKPLIDDAHGIGWAREYCSATCAFQDN